VWRGTSGCHAIRLTAAGAEVLTDTRDKNPG
jgi:hypothetical protein